MSGRKGERQCVKERERKKEQDIDMAAVTGPPQAVIGEGCDEPGSVCPGEGVTTLGAFDLDTFKYFPKCEKDLLLCRSSKF